MNNTKEICKGTFYADLIYIPYITKHLHTAHMYIIYKCMYTHIHIFKCNYAIQGDNAPPKSNRHLTKASDQTQKTSFSAVGQESPRDSQTVQAVAIDLTGLLELEDKTLLLKIPLPLTLDTELGRIKLELTQKSLPCGLPLTVSKGAMPTARREKQSIALP